MQTQLFFLLNTQYSIPNTKMPESIGFPQHIAIIMDGNGRWAQERGLPKLAGHLEGTIRADEITEAAAELGVKVLTLYTFSTENWKRPKDEVEGLFKLLEKNLDEKEEKLNRNNIRFSVIGRIDSLPESIQARLKRVIDSTKDNTRMVLNLALNYGSRLEMVDAVKKIAKDAKDGTLSIGSIDEKAISARLYTKDLPDPDLLIRTSGEYRLSNFLLWQLSYSEIYVVAKLWPDFRKKDLEEAIAEFGKRDRRYGG
jgi:undecaprenyl diphosphate synthase